MSELDAIERRSRSDPADSALWFRWQALARRQGWRLRGRSLDEWCRLLFRGEPEERAMAREATAALGPLLVPALLPFIEGDEPAVSAAALALALSRGGWPVVAERVVAVALDAGPRHSLRLAQAALERAEALPPEARDALYLGVRSEDRWRRDRALFYLSQAWADAGALIPRIRGDLGHARPEVRRAALRLLARHGWPSEAHRASAKALADPDPGVRDLAFKQLLDLPVPFNAEPGPVIRSCVEAPLTFAEKAAQHLFAYPEGAIPRAIAAAREARKPKLLAALMNRERAALDALIELYRTGDAEERLDVIIAALEIGPGGQAAIDLRVAAEDERDPRILLRLERL